MLLAVSFTKSLESVVNAMLLGCNENIESIISNIEGSAASLTLIKHFVEGLLGVFQLKLFEVPVISLFKEDHVVPLSMDSSSFIFSILLLFHRMVILFCTESVSPPLGYKSCILLSVLDFEACPSNEPPLYFAAFTVSNCFSTMILDVSAIVESLISIITNLLESLVFGWIIQLYISKLAGMESLSVLSFVFVINFNLIKLTPPLCQLIGNMPPLLNLLKESIELNFNSFCLITNALVLIEYNAVSETAIILILP